ncbi:uncharacterized protein LOC144618018 [Crassostrea virginica]
MRSDIADKDSKYLEALVKQEYAINNTINEIELSIADLKKRLDSFDVNFVSAYKSRNEEFRFLPAQLQVTLLTFTRHEIHRKQIYEQIGFLTELSVTTEEHDSSKKFQSLESTSPATPLIDVPKVISDIETAFGNDNPLSTSLA